MISLISVNAEIKEHTEKDVNENRAIFKM